MSDIGYKSAPLSKRSGVFFINPFVRNMYKIIANTPCVSEIISNSTDTF